MRQTRKWVFPKWRSKRQFNYQHFRQTGNGATYEHVPVELLDAGHGPTERCDVDHDRLDQKLA